MPRDSDARSGPDAASTAAFSETVYAELRGMAERMFRGAQGRHSLQPTALVHEAYLRLAGKDASSFADRAHLLAVAATAMRQILVDHARARGAEKRGGSRRRVSVDLSAYPEQRSEIDVLALNEILERLRVHDARKARVVELRFFGGLGLEEVAEVLGVARSTVAEDWRFSRAWLVREMEREEEDPA